MVSKFLIRGWLGGVVSLTLVLGAIPGFLASMPVSAAAGMADLVVSSLSVAAPDSHDLNHFTVTFTIKNQGNAVSDLTWISVQDNKNEFTDAECPSLDPGAKTDPISVDYRLQNETIGADVITIETPDHSSSLTYALPTTKLPDLVVTNISAMADPVDPT